MRSGHHVCGISFCFKLIIIFSKSVQLNVFFCPSVSSIICQNKILLIFFVISDSRFHIDQTDTGPPMWKLDDRAENVPFAQNQEQLEEEGRGRGEK